MRIGELAATTGTGIETIRYYEREGLLEVPRRTPSGYRTYTEEAARRLRFIQRARALGFSLAEVHQLLALRVRPGAQRRDVRAKVREHLADIRERIAALQRMAGALEGMLEKCHDDGPAAACPILQSFES